MLDPFQQLDDVGEEIENRVATEILGDSDVGHDRRGHGFTPYFVTNGRNLAETVKSSRESGFVMLIFGLLF